LLIFSNYPSLPPDKGGLRGVGFSPLTRGAGGVEGFEKAVKIS